LFDYVIGAWGGDLERILTIGGDSEAEGPGKKRANRFKPVVQFMGPFKSNGGSKTHTFTLPPYMGSVRAMVIAANKGSYGFAEKAVAVKKPLMMLATMPRVLGPAEQIRIPVTVFATQNNVRNVTLSLQSNPFIEPVGSTFQNINFTSLGEQQVYFDARVKPTTGIGKVKLIATSGKERTEYEVELDIRNPNPPITSITERTLSAGQSLNTNIAAIGTGGSNKAVVEISSLPALNLAKRLDYLIEYPHGCVEQVTSSVFPQLVLNQMVELNNTQKLQVDANVRHGIEQLKNFQVNDGGFSYWPGENESDEWGTNYAGNFLLEANDRGYNVPSSMLQQWRSYERNKANAWMQTTPVYYGGDLVQAYRLYLLALAKAPELGAMNRLKEYKFITPEAKWRLAAAYHLMGQSGVALQLISGLPTTFAVRTYSGITFGSDLRDQAMVLETLTIMGRRAEAERLVRDVAAKLSREQWYSTQTTAYSLIAMGRFCGRNASGNKLIANGNIGGQNININSTSYVSQTAVNFKNRKANVRLTNKGNNVLYVRIINQGQPVSGDSMNVTNNPNVLAMSVSFITTTGSPLDVSNITQGTDFVAKVTIRNTGQRGTYTQMALSEIFPSGWEILNTRLYNSEGTFKSSPAEYMDIRDDRVYHYFDIKENETLTYYVQLNAAYPGTFYYPGVYCEAMYDKSISAGVNGKWVSVKQ
jgi:alpha-2-macroglobulin